MLLEHCKIHLTDFQGCRYLKRSMVLAALRTFPYTPVPGPSASLNRIGVFLCLVPVHTQSCGAFKNLIVPFKQACVEWFD